MASMAYKVTNFMVFFNFSMIITTSFIAPLIFPTSTPVIPDAPGIAGEITKIQNNILNIALTAGSLALFAFSLLIPTFPFVKLFYLLNLTIAGAYIEKIGLPLVFYIPLMAGLTIITFMGIAEYAARQKV